MVDPRAGHIVGKPMPTDLFVARGTLERAIDGDTLLLARLDWGGGWEPRAEFHRRVRLLGVDAPELRDPAERAAGLAAKAWVEDWLLNAVQWAAARGEPWPLRLQTVKTEVFGRYLAYLWRVADGRLLNDDLLGTEHGQHYRDSQWRRTAYDERELLADDGGFVSSP